MSTIESNHPLTVTGAGFGFARPTHLWPTDWAWKTVARRRRTRVALRGLLSNRRPRFVADPIAV